MIEKKTKLEKIEIVGTNVQLKYGSWFEDNGVVVSEKTNTRRVIQKEDDIGNEATEVKEICELVRQQNSL